MSFILNEYEVDMLVKEWDNDYGCYDFPNLYAAVRTLDNLVQWTNQNSDGWPYWSKPSNAARALQVLIHDVDRFDPQDISAADLRKALIPIKAFRTRQSAAFTIEEPAT